VDILMFLIENQNSTFKVQTLTFNAHEVLIQNDSLINLPYNDSLINLPSYTFTIGDSLLRNLRNSQKKNKTSSHQGSNDHSHYIDCIF
jgi:hypothetical protein